MNYQHAFHAGNFADLLKHALLLDLLRAAGEAANRSPLTVIDTHAGAGLYDLDAAAASRGGEARVARLLGEPQPPPVFAPIIRALRLVNPAGVRRYYPGSPVLIAGALRRQDRLVACEARADESRALARTIGATRVRRGDGWRLGLQALPRAPARALILIDPPFEAPGEAERMAAFTAAALRRNPSAVIALWAPIKHLAGLDGLRERLAGPAPCLAVEARLRPLKDPLRLNGCVVAAFNAHAEFAAAGEEAAEWIVTRLGEPGGEIRVGAW